MMFKAIRNGLARRKVAADISKMKRSLWAEDPTAIKLLIQSLEDMQFEIAGMDLVALKKRFVGLQKKMDMASDPNLQDEGQVLYYIDGKTAVIPIHGHILPSVPWIYDCMGIDACGMDVATIALKEALADPNIEDIRLDIDSPGGSVDGVATFGELVAASSFKKPITAHASGMAASAAYWIGSQADYFTATKGSDIGSIGVYAVYEDSSKMYEAQGIEVKVISSGGIKGAGIEGAPLTQEQIKGLQEEIDAYVNLFVKTVAEGRGMDVEKVKALATGKVWLGEEAKNLGLIDAVISPLDQVALDVEEKMNKELEAKIAALEAALATEKAEKEAAKSELADKSDKQKVELIDAAVTAGKITPQLLGMVKVVASNGSVEDLKVLLNGLNSQVRDKQVGNAGGENQPAGKPSIDAAEKDTIRAFGLTEKEYRAGAQVKSVTSDGFAILEDGTKKPLKEVFGG